MKSSWTMVLLALAASAGDTVRVQITGEDEVGKQAQEEWTQSKERVVQQPVEAATCATWPSDPTYGCSRSEGDSWSKQLNDQNVTIESCGNLCKSQITTEDNRASCCYYRDNKCWEKKGASVTPSGGGTGKAVRCEPKAATCATWPSDPTHGCDISAGSWNQLSVENATVESCDDLCKSQITTGTTESSCCYYNVRDNTCWEKIGASVSGGSGLAVQCKLKAID